MGEECIEFSLHTGLEAGEHGGNQGGKGQRALTGKRLGRQANGIEQFGGMQILSEIYKDILILRVSSGISMKISKLREKLYHTPCKLGRGGLKLRGLPPWDRRGRPGWSRSGQGLPEGRSRGGVFFWLLFLHKQEK